MAPNNQFQVSVHKQRLFCWPRMDTKSLLSPQTWDQFRYNTLKRIFCQYFLLNMRAGGSQNLPFLTTFVILPQSELGFTAQNCSISVLSKCSPHRLTAVQELVVSPEASTEQPRRGRRSRRPVRHLSTEESRRARWSRRPVMLLWDIVTELQEGNQELRPGVQDRYGKMFYDNILVWTLWNLLLKK